MRILIIEDEVTLSKTLSDKLIEAGHQADIAENIGDAKYYLDIRNYDLVLIGWGTDSHNTSLISDIKKEEQREFGEKLYEELKAKGVEVALDDRGERFGFKMKDAELIGFPYTVIIGKELANGAVQIYDRSTTEKSSVAADDIYAKIMELL